MLYGRLPARRLPRRLTETLLRLSRIFCVALFVCAVSAAAHAQSLTRELPAGGAVEFTIKNRGGRVTVVAAPPEEELRSVSLKAESPGKAVAASDVLVKGSSGRVEIEVAKERVEKDRVDLSLRVPARSRLKIETGAGAIDVSGPLAAANASTVTGTIRADVPTDALRYSFRWTASRPRVYSEVELGKVRPQRGGDFLLEGTLGDKHAKKDGRTELEFTTERGVIVFGADAASVPADLRERQLTEAARAIIASGNVNLIEAIRRVAPRYVADYVGTLPQHERAPVIKTGARPSTVVAEAAPQLMRLNASVVDRYGRALAGLSPADFAVTENGEARPVTEVQPSRTPFNLVLLLDVSGSVEERLDFIRKAALAFVNTASPQDRVAIVSFRDDVQLVSDFTTDRTLLAERIKQIEAGGSTALYDALAYTLVHTLQPLRGERTAVVVLSDGDDNRSFVPFPQVLEAAVESGAVIYPIYLPSGLIPSGSAPAAEASLDPVRTRYLTLTSRADEEGRRLAAVSGGVYYPVTRPEELQRAYDDVVAQLRTSYTISYASTAALPPAERRVRVRVNRDGATVRLSPAVNVVSP